jgi:hypothetical protein
MSTEERTTLVDALTAACVRAPPLGEFTLGLMRDLPWDEKGKLAFAHVLENAEWYYPSILVQLRAKGTTIVPLNTNEMTTECVPLAPLAQFFHEFTKWALKQEGARKLKQPTAKKRKEPEQKQEHDLDSTFTNHMIMTPDHINHVCIPWMDDLLQHKFTMSIPDGVFTYTLSDLCDEGYVSYLQRGQPNLLPNASAAEIGSFAHAHHIKLASHLSKNLPVPNCAWQSVVHRLKGIQVFHATVLINAALKDAEKVCVAVSEVITRDFTLVTGQGGMTIPATIADAARLVDVQLTTAQCRRVTELVRDANGGKSRLAFKRCSVTPPTNPDALPEQQRKGTANVINFGVKYCASVMFPPSPSAVITAADAYEKTIATLCADVRLDASIRAELDRLVNERAGKFVGFASDNK